ncbi:porin family protein [Flavobacterium zepuense]|uniref:Porin family protein n=1 Tax=Flavobacterium zepuense TaxID=2593302 RepID=A0A552V5U2_9FLAO|nr:outer membrane beta-barrel protein [Flavobacterium zepuense]TRW25836.1 porin family protein [Flavobacterium zepuense]
MKKAVFIIVALFVFANLQAQEEEEERVYDSTYIDKVKYQQFDESFRVYYIFPGAVGDNVLAKANKAKLGFGMSLSLITVYNFYLNAGLEFSQYDVTDASLAGNIDHTNITNYFGEIMYKIPVYKKITVNPKIGIGYADVRQKTGSKKYGTQSGTSYNAGFNVDYAVTKSFMVFAGLNYSLLKPETETKSEYKSFYGTLHQLNIVVGIKL